MVNSSSWMYTILPISAISGGLSVILPLYILLLKGTVFDVAMAITLFELISIPASLLWGDLTDKLDKTKLFILISIIGLFPVLIIFYLLEFVPVIETFYGIYAFIATASSPAINILIMSNRRSRTLPRYFSRYSVLAIIGSLAGMLPGLFIGDGFVKQYLLILLLINVISLVMAVFLINADKRTPKKDHAKTVKKSFAILNMLSKTPYILTGHALIDRIHSGMKDSKKRNIYVLLTAIALFNAGLYLFNSSYIPYLSEHSINYTGIFAINIINNAAQLGVYVLVLSFISKIMLERSYRISTLARGASYIMAVMPLFIVQRYFFSLNLLSYLVSGLAYALWNISSSVLLYTEIKNMHKGHYIGLWTAILGLSAVIGAFLSGIISSTIGYVETFASATVIIFCSFIVFERFENAKKYASNKYRYT